MRKMNSNAPRSKLGPLSPEHFDGDAFLSDTEELAASYSKKTNDEFAKLLEKLKKSGAAGDALP